MPPPLTAPVRLSLALLWLALLLFAGWWLSQRLVLSGDLRKFMPAARTPAQALLLDELGEGPGSRLLLVALSGANPETLAAQSQALRAALAGDGRFVFAANGGDVGLDPVHPGGLFTQALTRHVQRRIGDVQYRQLVKARRQQVVD